jgi:hypothetical protein
VWVGDDNTGSLSAGESEVFGQLINGSTGAEIGSDFRISDMGATDGNTAFDASTPDVAYNSTNNEYLVVWSGDDDTGSFVDNETEIFVQRINASTGAEIGTDTRISDMGTTDGNANFDGSNPAVAYSSTDNAYLVVWEGDDDTSPLVDNEKEIFGQRIDNTGTETGSNDFRISDMGTNGSSVYQVLGAELAWNSTDNQYLVVWQAFDNTGSLAIGEFEIFGQRIDNSGSEVGDNDFRVSDMGATDGSASFGAFAPAVTYNSTDNEFLVIWEGDDDTSPLVNGENEIFGQRINNSGVEIGINDFRISDMGTDGSTSYAAGEGLATYSTTTKEYFVVWEGDDNSGTTVDGESEIWGQRWNPVFISSLTPPSLDINAARNANVTATLNKSLSVGTASTFTVHQGFQGKEVAGTYGGGGSTTLTFDPSGSSFKAGEEVESTLTFAIVDGGYVWKFLAATGTGIVDLSTEKTFGLSTDHAQAVDFGDVDSDGDLDSVLGNSGTNKQNAVYLNNGSGTFASAINVGPSSDQTPEIVFVDVDGDGDPDVAVGNEGSGEQNVIYLNDGNSPPGFGSSLNFGTGSDRTHSLAFGDLEGDGDLDVIIGNSAGEQDQAYFNDGSSPPAYGGARSVGSTLNTYAVELGDFQNDGDLDVAVGVRSVQNTVYLNDGAAFFTTSVNFGTSSDVTEDMVLGDMDGDGDLDIVVGNSGGQNVVYRNDAATPPGFATTVNVGPSSDATTGIAVGDLDGDNDLDIVVVNDGEQNVTYKNDGNASPGYATSVNFGVSNSFTNSTNIADVDGNNTLDIAMGGTNALSKIFVNSVPITESTAAVGLSGASIKSPSSEVQILSVGLTGNGTGTLTSVAVTLSDLSSATGLASGDFTELRLYKSSDATLGGDTQIGSQSTVNIGTATTVSPTSTETPPSGSEQFYIVTAVISGSPTAGHAFKVGFAASGVVTSTGNIGTAVSASDANKVTISSIAESTAAAGISGAQTVLQGGGQKQIFSIGLTGDGVTTLTSVTVTVSDLSSTTGTVSSDFTSLILYKSTDNSYDTGDTQIGSQTTVNVGSSTTVSPTSTETPPNGTEKFYILTSKVSSTPGHAFKVGFAAGGMSTSAGAKGTAVTASDANKVTSVSLPDVPVLTAFNGSAMTDQTPALDWNDASGVSSYTLQYDTDSAFGSPTTVTGLTTSGYTIPSDLSGGTYYWRILSVGTYGSSAYSSNDSWVIDTERADPQGVQMRLSILRKRASQATASDSGTYAAIDDTVQVKVLSIIDLDTVIVGLSGGIDLVQFGNLGKTDTLTAATGTSTTTDTFTVKFAIAAGDTETTNSGVLAQAKVSEDGDGKALKRLNNLSLLPMLQQRPELGLVGDAVKIGIDGKRPVNTAVFDSVYLDTSGMGTTSGLRSMKKGDDAVVRLKFILGGIIGSNASEATVVVVDTGVALNSASLLDSALHKSTFSDLFNSLASETFSVTEGQFKNNQRVRPVAYLKDLAGNFSADSANAPTPEGMTNNLIYLADATFPQITPVNPNLDSGLVRFTGKDTAKFDYVDDSGTLSITTFNLNPLKFSVNEATTKLFAVSGTDSVDFGGQGAFTSKAFATVTSTDSLGTNTAQAGRMLDVKVVAEDSAGNVAEFKLNDVVQDVVQPIPERLFPKAGDLPGAKNRTINDETRHPIVRLKEDVDSVSVRYVQVETSPTDLVRESIVNLTAGDMDLEITLSDSLLEGAQYLFQVFFRDLAGNIHITDHDTLDFTKTFENPTADAFVVTLDSATTTIDSVIAGVNLPLKIMAVDTKTVGELQTVVTYGKPDVILSVVAEEQDVSGVAFSGTGVTDNGDGTATLDAAGWTIGSRVVKVKSTRALEEFSVTASGIGNDDSETPIDGELASLTVDAAEFRQYDLSVMEEGEETILVSGDFKLHVMPMDRYGNPSFKVFNRASNVSSADSLTASKNLLDSRVPPGNVFDEIWVEFGANVGDVQIPPGPQKVVAGGNTFTAVAPNREGGGLLILVRTYNEEADTSGQKSQDLATGKVGPLVFVPSGKVPDVPGPGAPDVFVDSPPDTLVVADYLGTDGKGDQGRVVIVTFPRTEDHEKLSQYRLYREISVTSTLDASGQVVEGPQTTLEFIPWAVVPNTPASDGDGGLVRAVVPALDNQMSRWGITSEWGGTSQESPVLAKRLFTKESVQQLVRILGVDPEQVVGQEELRAIFANQEAYVQNLGGGQSGRIVATLDIQPLGTSIPQNIRTKAGKILTTQRTISEAVRAVDNLPPAAVTEFAGEATSEGVVLTWVMSVDDRIVGAVPYRGYGISIQGVESYELLAGSDAESLEMIAMLSAGKEGYTVTGVSETVYRVDALDLDNRTVGETITIEEEPPTGPPQYTDVDGNPVYIVKPDGNSPFKQDFEDFIAFAQAYDSSDGDDGYSVLADTDQNGTVEFADFIRFAQAYEREAVAINGQPIAAGKIVE